MSLRFLTAGESHGPALTAILEGIPAGLQLDESIINLELTRRQKGYGAGPRMKIEQDAVQILSGVMAGETIGSPIAFIIENADHKNWQGKDIDPMTTLRPGHADLTGAVKYGYRDLRPSLERASARETTMRVAVGAVCKHFLAQFGIKVGGYVSEIGNIKAEFKDSNFEGRYQAAENSDVRCPDPEVAEMMRRHIKETIKNRDTAGGVIEIFVINLPAGLGSFGQWDTRLEAQLAQAVLSVQAIKGLEIGTAFENTKNLGSKVQDEIRLENEMLVRPTNRAGGIEGGISNGQSIIIRAAMKPIATTLTPQMTVDLATGEESPTVYERSDFCPVPRAVPILEAMVSYVIADNLIQKLGGDSLDEMKPRFDLLRKACLRDLPMDNQTHRWWG
ncbi:MAG: chorismate synthase [Anaerolineales bacterium]|nr:chorismate synthase [Anaerolineales bacterium]